MMLLALPLLRPCRPLAAPRLRHVPISPHVPIRCPPTGEKPRKIRDLRRSAARARCGDRILLTTVRACYSNVRKILPFRDLTMANFNTVAGCVLASALFAMVVGKVSNAVVHPHKLDKPALAVVDEAPTPRRPRPRRRSCAPIGPLLAKANVEAGKAIYHEAVLHLPHHRQGRRQQGRPEPVGHRRPQEGQPRGLQLLLGAAGQGRRVDLRRPQPHDLQADGLRAAAPRWPSPAFPRSRSAPT